jgi:alpha-beta hydrolase superfamily lysophospholipase
MPPARPTYLDTAPDPTFAFYHEASTRPGTTAVLVCAPWGWDEVASHRSRRAWAERLAAAGHPTLRFALPASGNSGGSPRDPGRLDAWVGAIGDAVDWLRGASGCAGVAVLGLGLGGLLAREALARGARIEELALWAAPASGRAFVRETRAFSRLQAWHALPGKDSGQPEGSLEAGGFLLTAETLASLQGLEPAVEAGGSLRRALLLERDGVAVDEGLREALEQAGVEVSVAPGNGWAQMVSHAERTRLPLETADRFAAWLADGEKRAPSLALAPAEPSPVLGETTLDVDGRAVRESPFVVELPFGRAFGILAEPADEQASALCAVCLNAGAVRQIGPNRIWVETGRRWAAKGVRTLRVDLEGIGESDGEAPSEVAGFYLRKFEDQLRVVIDRLEEKGLGTEFLLVGLCGGGYWAFRETLRDPRVTTALLLNSGALEWDPALIAQREARKLGRAADPGMWRKLLRGEVSAAKLGNLARSLVTQTRRRAGGAGRAGAAEIEADLDRLRDSGISVTMAFSDREPLFEELQASGILGRLKRWPNVELARLPGDDHTLRPIGAQAGARSLLDRGLEQAIGRGVSFRASSGARAVSQADGRGSRARDRVPRGAARPAAPTRRR